MVIMDVTLSEKVVLGLEWNVGLDKHSSMKGIGTGLGIPGVI